MSNLAAWQSSRQNEYTSVRAIIVHRPTLEDTIIMTHEGDM
jgi:hypothetical protein